MDRPSATNPGRSAGRGPPTRMGPSAQTCQRWTFSGNLFKFSPHTFLRAYLVRFIRWHPNGGSNAVKRSACSQYLSRRAHSGGEDGGVMVNLASAVAGQQLACVERWRTPLPTRIAHLRWPGRYTVRRSNQPSTGCYLSLCMSPPIVINGFRLSKLDDVHPRSPSPILRVGHILTNVSRL